MIKFSASVFNQIYLAFRSTSSHNDYLPNLRVISAGSSLSDSDFRRAMPVLPGITRLPTCVNRSCCGRLVLAYALLPIHFDSQARSHAASWCDHIQSMRHQGKVCELAPTRAHQNHTTSLLPNAFISVPTFNGKSSLPASATMSYKFILTLFAFGSHRRLSNCGSGMILKRDNSFGYSEG